MCSTYTFVALPSHLKIYTGCSMVFADLAHSLVFYVPPHDLLDVLQDAVQILGAERRCVVARELTKVLYSFIVADLGAVLACVLIINTHPARPFPPHTPKNSTLREVATLSQHVMVRRYMSSLSGAPCKRLSAYTLRHLQRYLAASLHSLLVNVMLDSMVSYTAQHVNTLYENSTLVSPAQVPLTL